MAKEKERTPSPWPSEVREKTNSSEMGMKVHLKLRSGEEGYARNMTEIHYGYLSPGWLGRRVAFESNIHGTGFTHSIEEIIEFEATPETEIAGEFWEPI